MLGRSWGDGVMGWPEGPECPERLRLDWSGCALCGLPGMAGTAAPFAEVTDGQTQKITVVKA